MAPSPVPLLRQLLTAYDENNAVASESTQKHCVKHLIRHLGHLEPTQINSEIAKDYAEARRKDVWTTPGRGAEVKGVADSTIKRELTALRAAIGWAWKSDRKGWFRGDGKPEFAMPKFQRQRVRDRWLTKEEARHLLSVVSTPHTRLFIQISLETAARKEAVEDLLWEFVNLETGYIDFGEASGNKLRPAQKLSDRLLRELRAAYLVRTTDYVLEWNGARVGDIKKSFQKAAIRAGFISGYRLNKFGETVPVTDVTPHILKHTSISWMVQSGMPASEITKFTETSVEMIERVYGKHDPNIYLKAHAATNF
jgi:integrase